MTLKNKVIERTEALIDKGEKVSKTIGLVRDAMGVLQLAINVGFFSEWRAQTESFLINLLGENHIYVRNLMKKELNVSQDVEKTKGILNAVKEDILGGYLIDMKTLISAEVFNDFLEMAEHLFECGYKDPAASLCGSVLENGFRRIALKKDVKIRSKEDLSSLNQKCADSNVYNKLIQKKVQVWIDIRNYADHGKFDDYSRQDVQDMLNGVRDFLTNYFK